MTTMAAAKVYRREPGPLRISKRKKKGVLLHNMDKADCQIYHVPAKANPMTTANDETPSSLEDTPPTASRPDRVSIVPEVYWSKSSCRSCTI